MSKVAVFAYLKTSGIFTGEFCQEIKRPTSQIWSWWGCWWACRRESGRCQWLPGAQSASCWAYLPELLHRRDPPSCDYSDICNRRTGSGWI